MTAVAYIDTTETFTLGGCAPEPIQCECSVYLPPAHLRVQLQPEIKLRSVRFSDGAEVYSDRQHHADWPAIEEKCREAYQQAEIQIAAAFGEFLGRKAA